MKRARELNTERYEGERREREFKRIQLTRRQIKRKERFAKYRFEKRAQRQLVNNNAQQTQPQQLQQHNEQLPQVNEQHQYNVQQHSAPSVQNLQQNYSGRNDQPNVIVVQVNEWKQLFFSEKHMKFPKKRPYLMNFF